MLKISQFQENVIHARDGIWGSSSQLRIVYCVLIEYVTLSAAQGFFSHMNSNEYKQELKVLNANIDTL